MPSAERWRITFPPEIADEAKQAVKTLTAATARAYYHDTTDGQPNTGNPPGRERILGKLIAAVLLDPDWETVRSKIVAARQLIVSYNREPAESVVRARTAGLL